MEEDTVYPSCINCFFCKRQKGYVYCYFGLFKESVRKIILYTPYDFDCENYSSMDD